MPSYDWVVNRLRAKLHFHVPTRRQKGGLQSQEQRRSAPFVHKTLALLLLSGGPFALSGCYDRQELEQQAFVTTLGLDKAPDGQLDCTFRIAVPVNPASGSSKEDSKKNGPITIHARSVSEAMLMANTSLERTVTFSHLAGIIFGQKLAESGVVDALRPLVRFREFRQTVSVSVSKGTARDVIANFHPVLEQSAGRINDSIAIVGKRTGLFPVAYLHDLTSTLETPHEGLCTPLYAMNHYAKATDGAASDTTSEDSSSSGTPSSEGQSDKSSGRSEQSGKKQDVTRRGAGEIVRSGGNPVDFAGAAVFRGDRMVDALNTRQALLFSLLHGGLQNGKFDFDDPFKPAADLGVALHSERMPTILVNLTHPVRIRIRLPLDADIINVESGYNFATPSAQLRLEKSMEKQLNAEETALLERLLVRDRSDCVPVSRYIRPKFATYPSFAAYPWEKQMQHAIIDVQSEIHVRRFGTQVEPLQSLNGQ